MNREIDAIQVAFYGADARSLGRFKNIFMINFRRKCCVSSADTASVVIIDLEGLSEDLDDLLSRVSGKRIILLSETGETKEGCSPLKKPAKLDDLWQLISGDLQLENKTSGGSAARSLEKHVSGGSSDVRRPLRKLGSESRYRVDEYFLGFLLQQLDEADDKTVLSCTLWNHKRLIICPREDALYTDLSKHQLRNLTATPLAKHLRDGIGRQWLSVMPSEDELSGMLDLGLERTLWSMGYATSRGRLPENLDVAEKLYLAHWPNFTRLPAISNGMRIASVWAGEPQTLDAIANQLEIAPEEVYAFYAGAAALGLTGLAQRQSDNLIERRKTPKHPKKNLMNALVRHIGSIVKRPSDAALGDAWSKEV